MDLENFKLRTKWCSIDLKLKPNLSSEKYIVSANSKQIIEVPVDVDNGDIFINSLTINSFFKIAEGIYHAKNWYSFVEVANISDEDQVFFLEQPIKVQTYDSSNFFEVNFTDFASNFNQQFEVHSFNVEHGNNTKPDISKLLRTDHLNSEEKKVLMKSCKEEV